MEYRFSPTERISFTDEETKDLVALKLRVGPKSLHKDVTFGALHQLVARRAAALLGGGCGRGERVALLMPHGEELIVTFFACLYAGLVPSIIAWPTAKMDPEKYRRNVDTVVARLAAQRLVTDGSSAEQLGSALGATAVIDPSCLSADHAAAAAAPQEVGPLFVQFSGGTTGTQKSVPISARHLVAQLGSYASAIELDSDDTVISWLPLYHDMGLVACLLMPFFFRLPVVVFAPMEWVMKPALFLESVGAEKATLCWLPNFAFSFMASRVKASPNVDLRSLRAAINCSEPVRAESMDAFARAFGGCGLRAEALQASYAMAESTFAVTQTPLGKAPQRLSVSRAAFGKRRLEQTSDDAREIVSSGVPIDGAEVRIVDENGGDIAADQIGEILVRGPFVMDDYLAAPEAAPRASFIDDWYKTGDLGALHEGQLYVTGRKKDVIIIGGVNVFPEDVEAATSSVRGIHAGRTVALGIDDASIGTQRLVVVAEVDDASTLERSDQLERDVRSAVMAMCGVAPGAVFLVPPKWIVKSTAGKTSRVETRARLISSWGELNRDGRVAFSPSNGDA